jgi:hypothetical protein
LKSQPITVQVKQDRLIKNSENPANPEQRQPAKNGQQQSVVAQKVAELIQVIEQSDIDGHSSRQFQKEISEAFDRSAQTQKKIAPFKEFDQENNLSREELLEGLEKLLAENQIDSRITAKTKSGHAIQKGVMFILSILLIAFGFAMIIMPAPPSFEIFTVYYFNANDGVTVMDLVSLLIIFGGVLMFVLNFNKK